MSEQILWLDPRYREIVFLLLSFIFLIGGIIFFYRDKNIHFTAAWASFKSWLLAAPIMLLGFGFASPWPLVLLVFVGIYAAKLYFQMVGMYHRSWFVWSTYLFLIIEGWLSIQNHELLYNITPMIYVGFISAIPLIRNSSKHMIKYIALSQLAFIFFGWSFLHLGRLLKLEDGIFIVLYIYILAELAENASMFATRFFGKHKFFKNISNRISFEGLIFSLLLTLLAAWALRHLLPNRSEIFWISSALIASIIGRSGSLFISVIRKDLGIKDTGVFIIGRGDIIDRMDKLIFIGPVFYYTFLYLTKVYG